MNDEWTREENEGGKCGRAGRKGGEWTMREEKGKNERGGSGGVEGRGVEEGGVEGGGVEGGGVEG